MECEECGHLQTYTYAIHAAISSAFGAERPIGNVPIVAERAPIVVSTATGIDSPYASNTHVLKTLCDTQYDNVCR